MGAGACTPLGGYWGAFFAGDGLLMGVVLVKVKRTFLYEVSSLTDQLNR